MACCALAAILIGQLLLAWGKLRGWLGRSPADPARSAAEWRFGDTVLPQPARKRGRIRSGAALVALGIAGVAGAAVAATGPRSTELGDTGIHVSVCGDLAPGFSWTRFFGSN